MSDDSAINTELAEYHSSEHPSHPGVRTMPGKGGHGMLLVGPSNRGGPGRPPDRFREDCRGYSRKGLDYQFEIAKGTATKTLPDGTVITPTFAESSAAWERISKYGYGESKEVVPDRIIFAHAEMLSEIPWLTDEQAEDLIARFSAKMRSL